MRITVIVFIVLLCARVEARTGNVGQPELIWVSGTMLDYEAAVKNSFNLSGELFTLLNNSLDQNKITILNANAARAMNLVASHKNACMGNRLKTSERQKDYVFTTIPQTIFLNQRLYVNNAKINQFLAIHNKDAEEPIASLNLLLNSNLKMVLGLEEGKSFGKRIDNLLAHANENITVWRRTGDGLSMGLVEMFYRQRLDVIIDYPSVFEHYVNELQNNAAESSLKSYAIEEMHQYELGFIMCSNSPAGKRWRNYFDQQLSIATQHRSYLETHLKWFKLSSQKQITRIYNQVYSTQF